MIANVLLSVIVLLINKMVDGVLGSDGVYMVAVCIQLLLITFVVLNGVLDATFAIGGMLLGEHDITGLKMLNRKVMTFSCAVLVPFSAFVAFAPGAMATLFGADDPALRAELCRVLRIFSAILLPFSLTVLLRGMYQVLGYLVLSVGVAVGQVASIVVAVFVFTQVAAPDMLWWGFPLSAGAMLLVQVGITWRMSRGKGISPLTLIPAPDAAHTYSATVPSGQASEAMAEVRQFLKNAKCSDSIAEKSLHFTEKSLTDAEADICIHIEDSGAVSIVLKDTSKPTPTTKQAFGITIKSTQIS